MSAPKAKAASPEAKTVKETAPPAKKKTVTPAPVKETKAKVSETPKTVKSLNLDKLAHAIAIAETGSKGKPCVVGFGREYNNCFGIKQGRTAPCKRTGRLNMCIYDRKEDSYKAFKKIWPAVYGGFPTPADARKWTGKDRAVSWLRHVTQYYNS